MKLIVAVDERWGIGRDNKLLFHIKSDMEFFKNMTIGKTVVMGRKTFDSLPVKPLKSRKNIVLTRDENFSYDGVVTVNDMDMLLSEYGGDDVFVIGGGEVYKKLLPYCNEAYVTKIHSDGGADTYFPDLDNCKEWILNETSPIQNENGIDFRFCTYTKCEK